MIVETKSTSRVRIITHRDLPDTDGEMVQNPYQLPQATLLHSSIMPVLDRIHGDEPYLLGSDSGIYWSATKEPLDGCKAPDWYYIPGVTAKDEEGEKIRSYVIWSTGIRPSIVMEFVSGDGKDEHDKTYGKGKFWVYEQGIGAKYYVIFDTFHGGHLELYELVRDRYRPVLPNSRGHYPIADLDVELGVWQGVHEKVECLWMRFFDSNGIMLPSGPEREHFLRERVDAEKQRAEKEKQRADRSSNEMADLLTRMKAKGIDPSSL